MSAQDAVDSYAGLCALVRQWFAWLGWLLADRRQVGDVIIEGFSVRCDAGAFFIVVRGLRVSDMEKVVAFGRGEVAREAFRNVTTAIAKQQWKQDKFKKFI
jgi:hypothetical protein